MGNDGWDIPFDSNCQPDEITPAKFEGFIVAALESTRDHLDDLVVTLHDKVPGSDGEYDFDATVRFKIHGMKFMIAVEAKKHNNPIKRELVQVLHQKVQSVGANKGLMISTAPYQSGAKTFAQAHGITLATVVGNRVSLVVPIIRGNPSPVELNRMLWQAPYSVMLSGYFNDIEDGGQSLGTVFYPARPDLIALVFSRAVLK
jgi:hypothetical protein